MPFELAGLARPLATRYCASAGSRTDMVRWMRFSEVVGVGETEMKVVGGVDVAEG